MHWATSIGITETLGFQHGPVEIKIWDCWVKSKDLVLDWNGSVSLNSCSVWKRPGNTTIHSQILNTLHTWIVASNVVSLKGAKGSVKEGLNPGLEQEVCIWTWYTLFLERSITDNQLCKGLRKQPKKTSIGQRQGSLCFLSIIQLIWNT